MVNIVITPLRTSNWIRWCCHTNGFGLAFFYVNVSLKERGSTWSFSMVVAFDTPWRVVKIDKLPDWWLIIMNAIRWLVLIIDDSYWSLTYWCHPPCKQITRSTNHPRFIRPRTTIRASLLRHCFPTSRQVSCRRSFWNPWPQSTWEPLDVFMFFSQIWGGKLW
jgi:hypothetical protein